MNYLIKNSYFKDLLDEEIWRGSPMSVDDNDLNSIKVTVQTDVSGVLRIYHSIDNTTWDTFGDEFVVGSSVHHQAAVKGRYFYVEYENGVADAIGFKLLSHLSKSIHVSSTGGGVGLSEVQVVNFPATQDVSGTVTVEGLLFDASGNLKVSGISGGGVSSNVTVDNFPATQAVSIADSVAVTGDFYQTTQPVSIADNVAVSIAETVAVTGDFYQTTQPVSIADSVAVTGDFYQTTQPVSIADSVAVTIADSVAVTGDFYQTTQPVSIADELSVRDASAIELLSQIADGIVVQVNEVDISGVSLVDGKLPTLDASAIAVLENIYIATGDTAVNTTPIAYSPVHLDLETQGATVWADSTENWTAPLNGEGGWQYDNTTIGGANAYFYSNTSLVAGGLEPDITLGSLMNMSFVANIENYLIPTATRNSTSLLRQNLLEAVIIIPECLKVVKYMSCLQAPSSAKGLTFYFMLALTSHHSAVI